LDGITDAALSQRIAPGHRTLGELAWHLTTALQEIAGKTGLRFDAPEKMAPQPRTAVEIRQNYRGVARNLSNAIADNWTDETLEQSNDIYGMEWKNGTTLMVLLHHQIHHRGQLTVLMRQAGLKLPGIYGPSADGP
jgi:uncharacterized damage-inducible protein DinB